MKYEYRKSEKNIYCPDTEPQVVRIGKQKYLCITGKGNPNNEDFKQRVDALYTLAYAVRMMPKKGFTPEGYFEYTVYPLEGRWSLSEAGIQSQEKRQQISKDEFEYTIMIRQPDFVTEEVVSKAVDIAKTKKYNPLIDEIFFNEQEDGRCVQMLHIGKFDDEPKSFAKMIDYINENGYKLKSKIHREIYLSDSRRVAPEKQKTILRYLIEE